MKFQFSQQIFEKSSNLEFHENPSSGGPVVPFGRTEIQTEERTDGRKDELTSRQRGEHDMINLVVAFAILQTRIIIIIIIIIIIMRNIYIRRNIFSILFTKRDINT